VLQQHRMVPPLVAILAPIFAKSNAFVNPLVYFLALKSFRQEALRLMPCRKGLEHFHLVDQPKRSSMRTSDGDQATEVQLELLKPKASDV
jgi:hypothetical protein